MKLKENFFTAKDIITWMKRQPYKIEKNFQYTFQTGLASRTYNELKNNIKKIRNSVIIWGMDLNREIAKV